MITSRFLFYDATIFRKANFKTVQMKLDTPVRHDHVRFVCIGCTHGCKLNPEKIPPGDVLIIAGDFTTCGLPKEVYSFNKQLGTSYQRLFLGEDCE